MRFEGEAVVEGLSLAPLVVGLARDGGVQPVERQRGQPEDDPATGRLAETRPEIGERLATQRGKERRQPEGNREEEVRGLRVGCDTEEYGGDEGPAATPGHESGRDHGQAENLGRRPEQVEGGYGAQEQHEAQSERGAWRRAPPPQGLEAQPERQAETKGVGQHQAPGAEHADEGSGQQGVGERLREVEPLLLRGHAAEPRKPAVPIEAEAAMGALQEQPLRTGRELAAGAQDVPGLVAQVEILGQAPRHQVVRGAVAPELTLRQARQIRRESPAHQGHDHQADQRPRHAVLPGTAHNQPASRYQSAVRAIPSSTSTFGA